MIIKTLFTILAILTRLLGWAQNPSSVPFRQQGTIGIMDTEGNEFRSPGSFGDDYNYLVAGDFKDYITQDYKSCVGDDFIFHANNGDRLNLVNTKKNNAWVLGNADFDYRHFSIANNLQALLEIRHRERGNKYVWRRFQYDSGR